MKDGHRTPEPENSTYAVVVSQDSVSIVQIYADLNGLYVFACDIQNSYLQSPSSYKHFIFCGSEFGLDNVGKKALIVCDLYGVKRAGENYWRHV